jgi:membrane protein DedA with SNARE-associated domain
MSTAWIVILSFTAGSFAGMGWGYAAGISINKKRENG